MSQTNTITPLSLNGGVFLASTQFNEQMHLDVAHVLNQNKYQSAHKLGVITPFIANGYLDNLSMFNDFSAQRIEVDSPTGLYEWETPEAMEETYIVEDLSGSDTAGIDGQNFKLRLNRRAFGNTSTVKFSQYDDFDLFVTNDEILNDAETGTWVYTFRLLGVDSPSKFVPKHYLQPGQRLMHLGSEFGEFDTVYNDISWGGKMNKFYNYVGQTQANIHFSVTDEAAYSRINSDSVRHISDYRKVIEMYMFKPGSDGFYAQLNGQHPLTIYKGDRKQMESDIVMSKWIPEIELLAAARLRLDVENTAMWGSGGTVQLENGVVGHRPIGLWLQLNRGNKHNFSIENFTIGLFNSVLSSYLRGRKRPFQNDIIEIETGDGGIAMIQRLLSQLPSSNGQIWNAERFITGEPGNLKYTTPRFREYTFDFGTVRFKVNPALNPVKASDVENPMIGSYRLSSYMFIIRDLTGAGDNIKELVKKDGWDYKWYYDNGKIDYMGRTQGFMGKNVPYGFKVFMEMKHKAYWVMDPTRAFLMKPYNPMTGQPFGESSYFTGVENQSL